MKKILPLLLLLLLLIFFCALQKMDKITLTTSSATKVATVPILPLKKRTIEYTIEQTLQDYTLNGNFTDIAQQSELTSLFNAQNTKLSIGNISTNTSLLEKGSIALTKEIIPYFIKEYKKGKIHYTNEILIVEGEVTDYEVKNQIQKILASSHVASQNDTKVILPKKPIDFIIRYNGQRSTLSGNFTDTKQEDTLQDAFKEMNAPVIVLHVSENAKLLDFGGIDLSKNILSSFTQNYTEGEISYRDKTFTVKGKAKSKAAIEAIEKLLSSAQIPTKNLTTLDKEYLKKIADSKRVKEEARLAMENRKLAEEKARLEQEAAQKDKLEEEQRIAKEKEIALQKRLEEERKRKEVEKERLAQEEQAKLARLAKEESIKKAAQEKEAKANILKLLKMENIEFNTAKSTLTLKGKNTVNKLASILKRYPEVNIEIAGHTDSDGSDTFNQTLSQSRVDTVKTALISQGVRSKRLVAKGYGESKPLVPNTTGENKQKNRRVEINIIGE